MLKGSFSHATSESRRDSDATTAAQPPAMRRHPRPLAAGFAQPLPRVAAAGPGGRRRRTSEGTAPPQAPQPSAPPPSDSSSITSPTAGHARHGRAATATSDPGGVLPVPLLLAPIPQVGPLTDAELTWDAVPALPTAGLSVVATATTTTAATAAAAATRVQRAVVVALPVSTAPPLAPPPPPPRRRPPVGTSSRLYSQELVVRLRAIARSSDASETRERLRDPRVARYLPTAAAACGAECALQLAKRARADAMLARVASRGTK